jgi:hypothetical protein
MKKVSRIISEAMVDQGLVAQPYDAPSHINGKPTKVVTVRDNIIRIQASDPIAFLMNVMDGRPLTQTFISPEGEVMQTYIDVPAKERIKAAMFLAGKLMPQMHLVQAVASGEESKVNGKTGFEALVDEALNRGRQISASTEALGKKPG